MLWSPSTTALSLLAWVGAVAVALLLRKRYPLLVFALLFYLVAHSMESTILPLEMVFEHRNYLPSVGVCLLVAAGVISDFRDNLPGCDYVLSLVLCWQC